MLGVPNALLACGARFGRVGCASNIAKRGFNFVGRTLDALPVSVKMYIYTKFFKKDPLFRVVFNVSRWFHAFFYSFRKFTFF